MTNSSANQPTTNSYPCVGSFSIKRQVYILDSSLWCFLDFLTILWCTYTLAYGLVLFIIRMRSFCGKRREKFSCLAIFFSFFSQLDSAINPLSLTKHDFKLRLKEIESQMSSRESRVSLDHVTTTTLLARLDLVEAANGRLRTELRTIRSILTSNVALRDKMVLLEHL